MAFIDDARALSIVTILLSPYAETLFSITRAFLQYFMVGSFVAGDVKTALLP